MHCALHAKMNEDKERLLKALIDSAFPISAKDLGRTLNVPKAIVNNLLYGFVKQGKAEFSNETNPPLWSATVAAIGNTYSEEVKRLVDLLRQEGKSHGISKDSLVIALGKSSQIVNQMLYSLENEGEVERVTISPPIWKARSKATGMKRSADDMRLDQNKSGDENSTSSNIKDSCSGKDSRSDEGSAGKRPRLKSQQGSKSYTMGAAMTTPEDKLIGPKVMNASRFEPCISRF